MCAMKLASTSASLLHRDQSASDSIREQRLTRLSDADIEGFEFCCPPRIHVGLAHTMDRGTRSDIGVISRNIPLIRQYLLIARGGRTSAAR